MPASQQRRAALKRARAYSKGTRRSRQLRHLPCERTAHSRRPAICDQLPRPLFQPQHAVPSGAQI
eukprot:5609231-Pleurochrysis_carterae.AAC.1